MNRIALMNRERVVALFDEHIVLGVPSYSPVRQLEEYLPYGFKSMDAWLENRPAA